MGDGGSQWDVGCQFGMWGVQVYMIAWMEEMRVVGAAPLWDTGGPDGIWGSHLDVGCPGLHDRLDGGDAGAGGRPHFGIWGVLMGDGVPNGIRWDMGVPMEYGGSHLDVGCPGLHD